MKLTELKAIIKEEVINALSETRGSVNESQWADQVPGNDEIVWVKTKEIGSKANYTPFYRGHEFDKGGYTFGSQSEMDKFINDYILSNQMYNKLKHEPVKPINK
jgi:hypothetical protein